MKKVIIGAVMFMTGVVSAFILLGGAMAFQFEHINLSPFSMTMQILAQYGLTAFLYAAGSPCGCRDRCCGLGIERNVRGTTSL